MKQVTVFGNAANTCGKRGEKRKKNNNWLG